MESHSQNGGGVDQHGPGPRQRFTGRKAVTSERSETPKGGRAPQGGRELDAMSAQMAADGANMATSAIAQSAKEDRTRLPVERQRA